MKATQHPAPSYLAQRLERLRDEIRLDVHLARMDARDRWREVEPRLFQAERLAEHLVEISFDAVGRIASEVKRFQDQRHQPTPRG
jgi:hypothetical protein